MSDKDTVYGWTYEQWAWAADWVLHRGESLPREGDVAAELDVMETWELHRLDDPAPAVMLSTNVLGQIGPPVRFRPEGGRWARLLMSAARTEMHSNTLRMRLATKER